MTLFCGIDVGGTSVKTALVTDEGEILSKRELPTRTEEGIDGLLLRLRDGLEADLLRMDVALRDLAGIGVGVAGFLDVSTGVVEEAVNLGWRGVPLEALFHEAFSLPVRVENDANVAALGEAWRGAGRGFSHVLCVTVGTGVGGGIVCNGELYRGSNGMAGEIGHLVVQPGGSGCSCGNAGCLETVASATAMVRMAQVEQVAGNLPQTANIIEARDVFQLAHEGFEVARQVVREAGHWLGYGLALAAQVMNPDVIVVGGGVSGAGDAWFHPVRDAFRRFTVRRVAEAAEPQRAQLGNDAGVIGAARLIAMAMKSTQ